MTIRVGLIGYGLAGSVFHAPLIEATPGLELVGVVTSKRAQVEAELPGVRVVEENELLESANIDLVVVATPNRLHYEQARRALLAGKHVVVDKPFTLRSAEAEKLIRMAKREKRMLSVFHNRRWDHDFLTLKQCMEEGRLGPVHTYRARFDRYRPAVKERWKEQDAAGGGTLYDLGSHLIDQALTLFGEPDTVWAEVRSQRDGAAAPDWFHMVLGYDKGVRVILDSGSVVAEPGPRFEVHGTHGSFITYGADRQEEALKAGLRPGDSGWGENRTEERAWLTKFESDQLQREQIPSLRGQYEVFYQGIRDAILAKARPPVAPQEAARVIRVIERALDSSREKRMVPFK
ncbi:MAG: oxidoreductase [Firmicutes bacterium]|nr:oxidoreductase [Bacillota bacterium]